MEATTPKPAAPKAAPKKQEKISNVKGIGSAFLVILVCAIFAVILFLFVMGSPSNFSDNDPVNGHPSTTSVQSTKADLSYLSSSHSSSP